MTIKKLFLLATGVLLAVSDTACTKVLVHGRDKDYDPATQLFGTSTEGAYKAGKEALNRLGYKIETEDDKAGTLVTGWASTKATSHYVDLFDHRDYGTVGAYYRLKVEITEGPAGKTQVAVSAPTRSIITGRLHTSYREENKVLRKMADLLRTDDFEMTNVGVTEK